MSMVFCNDLRRCAAQLNTRGFSPLLMSEMPRLGVELQPNRTSSESWKYVRNTLLGGLLVVAEAFGK